MSLRARLVCAADIDPEAMLERLRRCRWWPGLPQDHPEVTARRDEILQTLAADDLILVKETLLATIYDPDTRTWGLINCPVQAAFVFRLLNRHSPRLKRSVERLVSDLQRQLPAAGALRFEPRVEVLEANSTSLPFWGRILPESRLGLALSERYTEAGVGVWALLLAAVFLILSSPLGDPLVRRLQVSVAWQAWLEGVLERFSTAALVTSTMSWVEVLLHWVAIRRLPLVQWHLD